MAEAVDHDACMDTSNNDAHEKYDITASMTVLSTDVAASSPEARLQALRNVRTYVSERCPTHEQEDERFKRLLKQHDALEVLTRFLCTNNDGVEQLEAVWILTNLAAVFTCADLLGNPDLPQRLMDLASTTNVPELRFQCFWCLSNLAHDAPDFITLHSRAIVALKDAIMHEVAADNEENVLDVMTVLIRCLRSIIVQPELTALAMGLVASPPPNRHEKAVLLSALDALVHATDAFVRNGEPCPPCDLILAEGMVPRLMRIIDEETPPFKLCALRILAKVSAHRPLPILKPDDVLVLAKVLDASMNWSDDCSVDVCNYILTLLRNTTEGKAGGHLWVSLTDRLVWLVVLCLRYGIKDVELHACNLLNSLAKFEVPSVRRELVQAGAIYAAVFRLRKGCTRSRLASSALKLLVRMKEHITPDLMPYVSQCVDDWCEDPWTLAEELQTLLKTRV